MTRYSESTSSRLPIVSDLQALEANQYETLEEDNKLAQMWFGHLGTKEFNKHITQSIQNSTVHWSFYLT